MLTLLPKASASLIATNAKNVSIKNEKADLVARKIIEELKNGNLSLNVFSLSKYHPIKNYSNAIDWIFISDALNFCFWNDKSSPKWKVNGESGYYALCAALKRAIEDGIDITNASFLSKITLNEVKNIFRGDEGSGLCPLLEERLKCLNEVGSVLAEKFNGTFLTCIETCEKSAMKLLDIIVSNFKCFQDVAVFCDNDKCQKVSFYKRAQILVADLWTYFGGQGLGEFYDINKISMFADYRVPQVLLHFDMLEYSKELYEKLSSDDLLTPGCSEEIEIRGCSIHAVEIIVSKCIELINADENLAKENHIINSIIVDFFLWTYRREHTAELEHLPFHKVRTIFY
ncbi:queuosine salvage protein [Trichogramma pretiosum]|uniref:queuosine salvage protein n=1 Tax=Trichogramma pretiosum TaxID=7493 RepID=UPI0006C952DC|nr:queuosine salvage protein [Trichogramma pretiosum]